MEGQNQVKGFGEGAYEVGLPVGQMPYRGALGSWLLIQGWGPGLGYVGGWSLLWIRVF